MKPWHQQLRDMGACDEALKWVGEQLQRWPDLTLEQAWLMCPKPEWMAWLARHLSPELEQRAAAAFHAPGRWIEDLHRMIPGADIATAMRERCPNCPPWWLSRAPRSTP